MKIAVLQLTTGIDPTENARVLEDAISATAAGGARMLFTPEMSGLLDRDRERARPNIVAEDEDAVLARMRTAAREAKIWVHVGSLAVRSGDKLANRGIVIDDQGEIRARYDKLHLFDVDLPTGESWRESAAYEAGKTTTVVTTPVGKLGLSICYDLRFSDLYRALSDAGAEILSIPSSFTRPTGAAHWHVLLRARAIEAGCFVVAAAQTGEHADGRQTFGHSLVIDPWGEVLLDMGETAGLAFADIDLARMTEVRSRVPAIRHRRPIPEVGLID